MAQEVYVTGSPAADRVRQYVVDTLTGYGLHPEVQDAVGVNAAMSSDGGMAHVRNIVAVLPLHQPGTGGKPPTTLWDSSHRTSPRPPSR
ncbi:hypothetical protein [Dactylosporangium sp. NPDC050588]|uniref:hypothetical protein n=1 Tax=Dactylosporangium sp. NPDC050588 TaxID=3157211 RepID=UPI0033DD0D37